MNSPESIQAWFMEIEAQRKEIKEKIVFLNEQKSEIFMKLELLTKLRHQLKTNMIDIYKEELSQIQNEIKSVEDLGHDLALLEDNLKSHYLLTK